MTSVSIITPHVSASLPPLRYCLFIADIATKILIFGCTYIILLFYIDADILPSRFQYIAALYIDYCFFRHMVSDSLQYTERFKKQDVGHCRFGYLRAISDIIALYFAENT